MDENKYLALAKKLNQKDQPDSKETRLYLPTAKIDDLSVHCFFWNLHSYKTIGFRITPNFIVPDWDEYENGAMILFSNSGKYENITDIKNFVKLIYGILPKLRFHKLNNEFKVDGVDEECDIDSILDTFITHPNIEKNYGCCSVCHENTTGKTTCNHHLCFICNAKIQTMANKNKTASRCPICRDVVFYGNDDEVD